MMIIFLPDSKESGIKPGTIHNPNLLGLLWLIPVVLGVAVAPRLARTRRFGVVTLRGFRFAVVSALAITSLGFVAAIDGDDPVRLALGGVAGALICLMPWALRAPDPSQG